MKTKHELIKRPKGGPRYVAKATLLSPVHWGVVEQGDAPSPYSPAHFYGRDAERYAREFADERNREVSGD